MASGWKHDINKKVLIFPGVKWTYKNKKNQHPHNIFLRSLKWNTVKSWRISKKTQSGKRRLQHFFYTCSWSMTKNSCRSNTISYRYLVCLLLCLTSSARFFLSSRLVTTTDSRTVLCQFHAKDGFKVLSNCHHEA